MSRFRKISEQGFTIIELMIATAVLSTILVIVTAVMINIGRLYYKGLSQARVQSSVRTIADDITQHLELTDKSRTLNTSIIGGRTVSVYCIGNTRYSFITGVRMGTQGFSHILWRDELGATCAPANLTQTTPSAGGVELVPDRSRLTIFNVSIDSPYSIDVGVAYGDDDLLTGTGLATRCTGGTGGQYCGTAALSTTAVRRLIPH